MSFLIAASLLPLDEQLSADLSKIADAEGISVLELCRMVGERLNRAVRQGRAPMDRQQAMTRALQRLVISYGPVDHPA